MNCYVSSFDQKTVKTQVSESKTRLRNIYKKFDKSVGFLHNKIHSSVTRGLKMSSSVGFKKIEIKQIIVVNFPSLV